MTFPVIGVAIGFLKSVTLRFRRREVNCAARCDLFQSDVIFSICRQSAGELLPPSPIRGEAGLISKDSSMTAGTARLSTGGKG
jgi:hypothetical protein